VLLSIIKNQHPKIINYAVQRPPDERIASSEFCATAEKTKDRSPATVPTSLHFTSLRPRPRLRLPLRPCEPTRSLNNHTPTAAYSLYTLCADTIFFEHISVLLTSHRSLDEPETGKMDMEIGSRCLRRIDTVSGNSSFVFCHSDGCCSLL
jgi:hypothetical protein